MKRILTIVMCVVMLVGVMAAFVGCDEDKTTSQTTTTTTQSTTTTTKQDETTTTTQVQTTTEPATTTTTTKQETTATTREATTTTKKPTTTTTTKKSTTTTTTKKSTTTTTTVQGVVSERDALIGSWRGVEDYTSDMNMAYNSSEFRGYITIGNFSFKLTFTFRENGTYSVRVDEDAARTMYEGARRDFANGFRSYLNAYLRQNGINLSADSFLATQGLSVDDFVDAEFSYEMLEYILEGSKVDGLYEVEDGIIYMNFDLEQEIDKTDPAQYDPYKITGDRLTMYANADDEVDIVLTRVK